MNYWKYVEVEGWEQNAKKIFDYSNLKPDSEVFRTQLEIDQLREKVPSFFTSLEKFGKVNQILVLIMTNKTTSLHNDALYSGHNKSIRNEARLQIPVLNAEYSETFFYDIFNEPSVINPKGSSFRVWPNAILNTKQPVASTVIDQPTILRITEPHYVICKRLPRIVLSIGITNDIVSHL